MTFAPPTLNELATYWEHNGGVNLGIVGDASHQAKGISYHLGRDELVAGAYSAKTLRDRRGLSEAASAIDLGKLNGSLADLRKFSDWLVDQARHNAAGTDDMREIIWSPDGKVVLRWDRERGFASKPQPGEADNSHFGHTHVSWYRDAEASDHRTAFIPYFSTISGGGSQDVPGVKFTAAPDSAGGIATVKADGLNHRYILNVDQSLHPAPAGFAKPVLARGVMTDPNRGAAYLIGDELAYLLVVDCDFTPPAPADTNAAYNAGLDAADAAVKAVPRK